MERLERAYATALRLLGHRERSRAELLTRLRAKGYDRETAIAVLDRLAEAGLQSDRRFAEAFALDARSGRGLSGFAIQGELGRRGVERSLAAETAVEDPEAEEERARQLALRRAARLAGLPIEARRRRLAGLLARRGYRAELCDRIAAEAARSVGPGDDSAEAGP